MAASQKSSFRKVLGWTLYIICVQDVTGMRARSRDNATKEDYTATQHDFQVSSDPKILSTAFINSQYTQQFEVEEDYWIEGSSIGKKYKFELEQFEANGGKMEIDVDKKLPMKVEPHTFTMHGRMSVEIGSDKFYLVKRHMTGTNLFGHYSWRVVTHDDDNNVLFTIQKRKWNKDCKILGLWDCKAVWKIYEGKRGDKSSLIYYGIGDAEDQDEPDFKFYHSEAEYKDNKKNWLAKIEHKEHEDDGEDEFKVKVKPNQDAALFLLATVCIDQVADAKRPPPPEEQHGSPH